MRVLHLTSALVAVLAVSAGLAGGILYARSVEDRSIDGLASGEFNQKTQGSVLQVEAFRHPELLPLYGSSELETYQGPYNASEFFRSFPTGFAVFPVGKPGTTALIILQEFAGVGREMQGRKVAISILQGWFIAADPINPRFFAGNFSPLHAAELAFSTDLSFELRRDAARRMLDFPDTLERDPLLKFAVDRLADDSLLSRLLYYLVLPLGKLENLVFHLQDHWETLTFIRQQPGLNPDPPNQAGRPDWASLAIMAERDAVQAADNNPFGFDHRLWDQHIERFPEKIEPKKPNRSDSTFVEAVQNGPGWTDLELLLRGLKELGAEPLILSAPMKGVYYDYRGVSFQARAVYYQKLYDVTQSYGVPLVDFIDHDYDTYFVGDHVSHLSPKGWVYYDWALDAFYYGMLPTPQSPAARLGEAAEGPRR